MALTPTSYSGTKGLYSIGRLKFKKDKQPLFNWAVEAFNLHSKYGRTQNPTLDEQTLNSYLTYFLFALEITSNHEGGFDAINTYDRAGISVGFIQFARPNVGVYRLLTDIDTTLRDEVREAFGNYPVNVIQKDYNDAKSLSARKNKELLERVQNAIITENGIKTQIKLAIEDFYDKAFEKFLTFEFENTFQGQDNIQTNPLPFSFNQSTNIDNYVFANALCFDAFVNLGEGKASRRIKKLPIVYNKTEGNFINYNLKNLSFAKDRNQKWVELFNKNFVKGSIFS